MKRGKSPPPLGEEAGSTLMAEKYGFANWDDERFKAFKKELVDDWASVQAEHKECDIWCSLRSCESPIEAYLCVALHFMDVSFYAMEPQVLPHSISSWPWDGDLCDGTEDGLVYIFQQVPVLDYRVDFLVVAQMRYGGPKHYIVVECDGHDFHERTKEQAARDRKRDREMTAAGFRVFRFTGREIFTDARKCAGEISEFLQDIAEAALLHNGGGQ